AAPMRARWMLYSVAFGVVACIAACSKKDLARSGPSLTAPVAPTPVAPTPVAPTPVAVVPPPAVFQDVLDVSVFQRGNLHAHSSKSDGDRPPDAVYKWYREHGYAFLAITDHNALTLPAHRGEIEGPDFAVIAGEEITLKVRGRPVHVNGLCLK